MSSDNLSLCVGRLVIHQARDSSSSLPLVESKVLLKNKYANIRRNSLRSVILTNFLVRSTRLKAWKLLIPILILVVYAEGYVNSAPAQDLTQVNVLR